MTWQYPTWWGFALLVLAAYRTFRLLALDTIFDRPRAQILRRTPEKYREGATCPFCFGAWVTVAWWLAWIAWPHWTLIVATPFAINAVVGLVVARLDPGD